MSKPRPWGGDTTVNFLHNYMLNYKQTVPAKKLDSAYETIAKHVEQLKWPKGFNQFILYALSELLDNVKEHSKSSSCTIFVSQKNKILHLEISDNGIGLRQSYIHQGIYPKDDSSAIQFAFSGLSTKDPSERGFGLYTLKKFITTLKGTLTIKSGKAQAKLNNGNIELNTFSQAVRGVTIAIKTPVTAVNFYQHIE